MRQAQCQFFMAQDDAARARDEAQRVCDEVQSVRAQMECRRRQWQKQRQKGRKRDRHGGPSATRRGDQADASCGVLGLKSLVVLRRLQLVGCSSRILSQMLATGRNLWPRTTSLGLLGGRTCRHGVPCPRGWQPRWHQHERQRTELESWVGIEGRSRRRRRCRRWQAHMRTF